MNRTPQIPVQRTLRQEVAYGCPVNGCRQPFLTWHHFDPTWNIRNHHYPKGMIALCRQHHDFADSGGFSKEELHELKTRSYSTDSVKAKFPWAKKEFLIRLGGNYSGGTSSILKVSGEPIIELTKGPNDLLLLSFVLKSPNGTEVARMIENGFQANTTTLHDLRCNASATRIKIWFAPRDIGLDLSFARLTMDELSEILQRDKERAEENPAVKRALSELPPSLRELIPESGLRRDPATSFIKRWASTHCLDDDNKITLLDFANVSIINNGRHIRIRNGICEESRFIGYNASFDNGGAYSL